MKRVKFHHKLVALVLSGEKTSTWRLFDDKDLSEGDNIELLEFGAAGPFGKAKIVRVVEKQFKDLTEDDKTGHENYVDDEEMYKTYSGNYKTVVGAQRLN